MRDAVFQDELGKCQLKYRPEIDGLRAVAIIPVVLFHAGAGGFEGGYLGVDVFFVISGYLITKIILGEIENKRFSVLTFYVRRCRRILPAYVVVLLVGMFFSWRWMMPGELRNFSQSVFASSIFSSNVLFWTEAGYFLPGSAEKPLLHTWSLSVEEQFYVFFPLMLLALSRLHHRWTVYAITLLTILSLTLSEYGWRYYPTANFYLLPFRAWELGIGALSAFYQGNHAPRRSSSMSAAGFIALVGSLAVFDDSTPCPSIYTLIPVLGTALIVVFASPSTWVGRILSHKYLVFIGLISYSTYLWHQPLLAFARIRSIPSAPDVLLGLAAASSFLMGYLSWRYIEQPFRKGGMLYSLPRTRVLGGSVVALASLAVIGLFGALAKGFPERLPARARALADFIYDTNPLENGEKCAFYHQRTLPKHPVPGCDEFLSNNRADVVFIGDSHSGSIAYDAQISLAAQGISSYSVTYSGCLGLRGFKHLGMPLSYDCLEYNNGMVDYARKIGAKVLIITSRFPLYLTGVRFDNGEGGVEPGHKVHYDRVGFSKDSSKLHDEARRKRMLTGMVEELRALTNEFSVVLLDPIPEAGWSVPQLSAKIAFFRDEEVFAVSTDYAAYKARTAEVIAAFDEAENRELLRVRPQDALCNRVALGRCINANEKEAYYSDNNHLSRTGARLLVPSIVAAVRDGLRQRRVAGP